MSYTFTPPTYDLKPVHGGPLLSRYRMTTAYSVIKRGSEYETVITPEVETFFEADFVYIGGHEYQITDAEAALLIAAGYTPTLES